MHFSPWTKIITICGVSVVLASSSSCVVVFMVPGWTSVLLRSPAPLNFNHFNPSLYFTATTLQ
jgi:hypothetical protein